MKRLLSLLLAVIAMALCACCGDDTQQSQPEPDPQTEMKVDCGALVLHFGGTELQSVTLEDGTVHTLPESGPYRLDLPIKCDGETHVLRSCSDDLPNGLFISLGKDFVPVTSLDNDGQVPDDYPFQYLPVFNFNNYCGSQIVFSHRGKVLSQERDEAAEEALRIQRFTGAGCVESPTCQSSEDVAGLFFGVLASGDDYATIEFCSIDGLRNIVGETGRGVLSILDIGLCPGSTVVGIVSMPGLNVGDLVDLLVERRRNTTEPHQPDWVRIRVPNNEVITLTYVGGSTEWMSLSAE